MYCDQACCFSKLSFYSSKILRADMHSCKLKYLYWTNLIAIQISKKCCTMILKLSNPTCQESLLVLWHHEIFSMFLVTSLLYFMKYTTISEREWWKWNILYCAVHYLTPRDASFKWWEPLVQCTGSHPLKT